MVDDRLTDGRRIAELLASELDGLGDALARVVVTDPDRDAVPTVDGAYAYRVTMSGDERLDRDENLVETAADSTDSERVDDGHERELAVVFVSPDRARVEFVTAQDVAAATADEEGLRVRPKAVRPPRTLVFVEDGAQVKRAVTVFEAVVAAVDDGHGDEVENEDEGEEHEP